MSKIYAIAKAPEGRSMRESKTLEFKSSVSASFLKTVSAFANYDGGTILFGVNDAGDSIGLADPVQVCLDIENRINDSISPVPDYSLVVHDAAKTVSLAVKPGLATPYLYRAKAYKRADTATVEVDRTEFTRLVLAGSNLSFEQLSSENQDLTFVTLGNAVQRKLGLQNFNEDTLKTLNLLSPTGTYNNAAAILSDKNKFPGIDMARFGESVNVMLKRATYEGESLLEEYDKAVDTFKDVYCYELIEGARRIPVETIPVRAFRESLANAVVHRTWDVAARVRVSMYSDRVEITSPGGLPTGISEEEYLSGRVSVMRNPILANVFYRLGIIEAFGTGIIRIKEAYEDSAAKPLFDISDNSISVTLPLAKSDLGLTGDQQRVYDLLSPVKPTATGELLQHVDFSRSKLTGILKHLVSLGLVQASGVARGTKYRRL